MNTPTCDRLDATIEVVVTILGCLVVYVLCWLVLL